MGSSYEAGGPYTIKAGDTLWAIARDHGVTIEDLQSWNPIPNPDKIIAGNRLIVRRGTRKTPGATASSSEAGESYTIKTGDTLWAIARDHGVTIEDLQSWNPIPNPDKIIAGNRLIVRRGTRKTPARSRHPEIKPQAFFSHTEQVLPGDESSPSAPHLISVVTNILKGKLATFNDVVNLQKAVGMQLERQIVDEVKTSSVFVAILTPAFSQRFWPMYELHLALEFKRFIVPVLFGTTYDALLQNFENIDPRASWRDSRSKEKVIKSSVTNLNTLSELVPIMWKYEKFDKNSIERFGKEVAEKVEEVAEKVERNLQAN